MILLLDNYDSFTWNLHHYLVQLTNEEVVVMRNDEIELDAVNDFNSIVLSPGPGLPSEAGIMPALIKTYSQSKPILGICLGHQALAEAYGAKLSNLEKVLHGVEREIIIAKPEDRLFTGLAKQITTGHYHSWVVSPQGLPTDFEITARDKEGNIMALSHTRFPFSGVQFHPESVMTSSGMKIVKNWLYFCNWFSENKKVSLQNR